MLVNLYGEVTTITQSGSHKSGSISQTQTMQREQAIMPIKTQDSQGTSYS